MAPAECSACVWAILVDSRRRVESGSERSRSRTGSAAGETSCPDPFAADFEVRGRSSGGRTMEGVTTVDVPGVRVPVDDDRSGGEG